MRAQERQREEKAAALEERNAIIRNEVQRVVAEAIVRLREEIGPIPQPCTGCDPDVQIVIDMPRPPIGDIQIDEALHIGIVSGNC